MGADDVGGSTKLFLSYCHEDVVVKRDLVRRLTPRLRLLHKVGLAWWEDSLLDTGVRWEEGILNRLNESDYGLLLLSMDFYASEFITRHELPCFVGPGAVHGALPVALKQVPLEGSFDLHGVPAHQIFSLEGRAYAQLSRSYHRDEFANQLAEAIRARILADSSSSAGWRTL